MDTTKRNKSISARKRYRRVFFYFIEKHIKKSRHFRRKKIVPEKVTYVPIVAPSHSIKQWKLIDKNRCESRTLT